jgi:hypothetical protein
MAITVDSSQWTGEADTSPLAIPVVWGEFANDNARDEAMRQLQGAGAQVEGAADIVPPTQATNEGQVPPPDVNPEGAEQRNLRQNFVGIGMAGTAMAAAGIVIASGGTLLPAVAAAAAAGAGTAAVGETLGNATTNQHGHVTEHREHHRQRGPLIGLRAPDQVTRDRAMRLLREMGANDVFVQETRAG